MSGKTWSPAELALLEREYANAQTADIARRMGRTESSVYQAAYKLGLEK